MGWVILIVIVVLIFYLIIVYNTLVGKRNKVKNAWSQIEVQLKRRFDLIPNLIEIVKGYTAHEKELLQKIAEVRSRFMSARSPEESIESNGEMSRLLGRLFAVAENYPDLKANENFLQLQQEIARTEDKISFSRQFYNDVVMENNNMIQGFPTNLIARLFGFKEAVFFSTEDGEEQNIRVKF